MTAWHLGPDNHRPMASEARTPDVAAPAQAVAVVTDSATALPADLAREAGLYVTPMEITIGDTTYEDGPAGVADDFYDMLRQSKTVPTTSAPRPGGWLERFRAAAQHAESIVCVTLAARLSASYDSARVAAEMAAEERPDVPIRVIDSDTAAGSEALITLAAARAAATGSDADRVEAAAQRVMRRVRLLAYLDTLEYVWRSGRVRRAAVWAASLFNVKPVMEFSHGNVRNVARPRSRTRAMERILGEMARDAGALPVHIAVMHADAAEEAEMVRRRVDREFNCVELFVSQFPPFMGAHTGPGLVGISFWAES